jgi:hypothetical protein
VVAAVPAVSSYKVNIRQSIAFVFFSFIISQFQDGLLVTSYLIGLYITEVNSIYPEFAKPPILLLCSHL